MMRLAESIARELHAATAIVAADQGLANVMASWDDLAPDRRRCLIEVVERLLLWGVIVPGPGRAEDVTCAGRQRRTEADTATVV